MNIIVWSELPWDSVTLMIFSEKLNKLKLMKILIYLTLELYCIIWMCKIFNLIFFVTIIFQSLLNIQRYNFIKFLPLTLREHKTIRKDQQIKIHILNIKSKYPTDISLQNWYYETSFLLRLSYTQFSLYANYPPWSIILYFFPIIYS